MSKQVQLINSLHLLNSILSVADFHLNPTSNMLCIATEENTIYIDKQQIKLVATAFNILLDNMED